MALSPAPVSAPRVSAFQGSRWPCDLDSLPDVRTVDFQFLQHFSCCEDENEDFPALYNLDRNRRLSRQSIGVRRAISSMLEWPTNLGLPK